MLIRQKQVVTVVWLILILLLVWFDKALGTVGMYGVNQDASIPAEYSIDTVFVPADAALIAEHYAAGRRVFLTLNAFGGSSGWKQFPDARPVLADGEFLETALGGMCPTHPGWRRNRLDVLLSWLDQYWNTPGIDGVWLDFIRYPGRWEEKEPNIPDTCYCPRCLSTFQVDSGITLPEGERTTAEQAGWIQRNALLPWMEWKKEQIASFARDARQLIRQSAGDRPILLGAFLVPWRKSDHKGAISFHLAQDAKLLAPYIDVFSPMVYHQMVGQPVDWLGELSDYTAEMSGKPVWPIIQAGKVDAEEFGRVVQMASRPSTQGLLVYTYRDMRDNQWPQLAKYKVSPNLLENPHFAQSAGREGEETAEKKAGLPDKWYSPPLKDVHDSKFWFRTEEQGNMIGLAAGYDRQAVWHTGLGDCRPGSSYLFSAEFLRGDRADGLAYPEVRLWGQQYRLNTHRMTGTFQKLKTVVTCPAEYGPADKRFEFRNNYPGNTFWMRRPELIEAGMDAAKTLPPPASAFFPMGIYGANSKNLAEIRDVGLNTAVIAMTQDSIETCLSLNMRCTLAVPHDPDKLIHALTALKPLLEKGSFAFYVNDEPEIHAFPEGQAGDIQRIIKQHFPRAITNMAIVRPQAIPFYEKSSDYFMLDQYPVPHMPMTWLAESMDEAAGHVGRNRLQSVIQAFGDAKHAGGGWPRLPTHEEMSCLAFLSVVHGSRGIYFYTFPSIAATEQGKEALFRLVGRLNSIKSWLQVANDENPVSLRMISPYQVDPRGNPAVHCTRKEQYTTQMLLCVNVLGTFTEAEIAVPPERQTLWQEYYSNEPHMVVGGTILARFSPYEVKVLMEKK